VPFSHTPGGGVAHTGTLRAWARLGLDSLRQAYVATSQHAFAGTMFTHAACS
jgi:hypothetical protein